MATVTPGNTTPGNTTPGNEEAPPKRKRGWRQFWPRAWFIVISAFGFGCVIYVIVIFKGLVTGEEFAPDHFQSREFSYYEIPFIHWQVTPIQRKTSTGAMERFLTQKNFVPVAAGVPSRWHLVQTSRGYREPVHDDAWFLADQLNQQRGGQPYWKKWTEDHPKSAAIAWPMIAKLADRELYILMPQLFEMLRGWPSDDADGLNRELKDYLQREYRDLIADMRDAGRDQLADELARESQQG